MKRHLPTILIALVIAALTSFALRPEGTTATDTQNQAYARVTQTGVLRCAYTMWSPVAFIKDPNTGAYSGFVPDYLALLAKNLGIKIEYVEDTGYGAQVIEGLKAGRFDAFCTGFNINAPRGRHVLYTDVIFLSPVYPFARQGDTRFKSLDAINNPAITLSTMDGEATDTIARNRFPAAKTLALPQNSEMSLLYSNVADGKADVIFSDILPVEAYNKNNPSKALVQASAEPVLTYTIGMAVNNDEPKLQAMLNAALMELQASGQIKALIKKYDPTLGSYTVPVMPMAKP